MVTDEDRAIARAIKADMAGAFSPAMAIEHAAQTIAKQRKADRLLGYQQGMEEAAVRVDELLGARTHVSDAIRAKAEEKKHG
jgi:hypothetical protein